jgi:SAM-dependent methyltransferase
MLDYDDLAEDYAKHRTIHPGVLRALLSTSHLSESSRVLEVGCGTGNYLAALQSVSACAASGVDPSEKMLTKARARGFPASLHRGRAEKLDFPDASFDLVFSVDVIHHVVGRAEYYAEAYRVLGDGGRLCTVTDSRETIRKREPLAVYFPETIAVELARYPQMEAQCEMMTDAGFRAVGATTVELASTTTTIQMYRDQAFSALHVIPKEAFDRGIRRMEEALRHGPIPCVSRYVMVWGSK